MVLERGISLRKKLDDILLTFLVYSFLGWCYEVFLEIAVYQWGFSNRGFLFGPYCPVYGFGALLLLAVLEPVKGKKRWYSPFLVFLGTMALTTALELITSYLLEIAIGHWLWDYTRFVIQFDGRIALDPSVRFGLGGLFILYGVQPGLERITVKLGRQNRARLASGAAVLLAADGVCTVLLGYIL